MLTIIISLDRIFVENSARHCTSIIGLSLSSLVCNKIINSNKKYTLHVYVVFLHLYKYKNLH